MAFFYKTWLQSMAFFYKTWLSAYLLTLYNIGIQILKVEHAWTLCISHTLTARKKNF
jgi:hypothetical protein